METDLERKGFLFRGKHYSDAELMDMLEKDAQQDEVDEEQDEEDSNEEVIPVPETIYSRRRPLRQSAARAIKQSAKIHRFFSKKYAMDNELFMALQEKRKDLFEKLYGTASAGKRAGKRDESLDLDDDGGDGFSLKKGSKHKKKYQDDGELDLSNLVQGEDDQNDSDVETQENENEKQKNKERDEEDYEDEEEEDFVPSETCESDLEDEAVLTELDRSSHEFHTDIDRQEAMSSLRAIEEAFGEETEPTIEYDQEDEFDSDESQDNQDPDDDSSAYTIDKLVEYTSDDDDDFVTEDEDEEDMDEFEDSQNARYLNKKRKSTTKAPPPKKIAKKADQEVKAVKKDVPSKTSAVTENAKETKKNSKRTKKEVDTQPKTAPAVFQEKVGSDFMAESSMRDEIMRCFDD